MYIRKYELKWLKVPEFLTTFKSVKEMKEGETFKPKYVEYSIDIHHVYIFEEIINGKIYQCCITVDPSNTEAVTHGLNDLQKQFEEIKE